uniref:Zinc finger protein 624 n=1 Tax=Cacopsylla melanoneura TaxID=428564 RepID=A0A8D8XDB5_9HEMI
MWKWCPRIDSESSEDLSNMLTTSSPIDTLIHEILPGDEKLENYQNFLEDQVLDHAQINETEIQEVNFAEFSEEDNFDLVNTIPEKIEEYFEDDLKSTQPLDMEFVEDQENPEDDQKVQTIVKEPTKESMNLNRRIHSCCFCTKEFRLVKNYHAHLQAEHDVTPNKHKKFSLGACGQCGKVFKSRENLRLHLSVHNEEASFGCAVEFCNANFKSKRYLIRHLKKYHSLSTRQDKDTNRKRKLVSSKDFIIKCEACNQSFRNHFEYGGHKLKCSLVLVKTKQESSIEPENSFTLGIRSDKITKPHVTKKSDPEVTTVWDDKTGTWRYPCTQCDRTYQNKKSLYVHVQSHKGVKYRYKSQMKMCLLCEKMVTNLSAHYKEVHEDERHFPCNHCDKTFKRKLHLTVHLRRHTGEKPYPCYFCEKRFGQIADRNKHLQAIHGFKKNKEL